MKNFRTVIKMTLLTLCTLGAGFAAIAFPFKLFDTLSADAMRYLFIGEVALYFTLGMLFLTFKEKKRIKKEKEAVRRIQRREKFERAQREYYDLAA